MEMMQSPLFWYKIQFMVELLAAEALATYTMEKRKYFTIRVIGVAAGCFLVAFYFPLLQFNAIYTSIMFYLFFAVSILGLRICYDEEWRAIVFCATLAYTVQYIAYQSFQYLVSVLGIQTVNLYAKQGSNQHGFWEIFIYFFCYAVLYWAAWAFVEHPIRAAKKLYVNNEQIFV